jgi:hypothetical protein
MKYVTIGTCMGSSTQLGTSFEHYAASLYEALHYSVKQDQRILGQQVDLVAQRDLDGVGTVKVYIECKFLSSSRSVSNEEVQKFVNAYSAVRDAAAFTHGVLVCNQKFSRDSHQVTEGWPELDLLTIHDLEQKLFHSREAYLHSLHIYEQEDIYSHYIQLNAKRPGSASEFAIEEEISLLVKQDDTKLITILGDFGTGKTTLLHRLRHRYISQYMETQKGLKPIYLELKKLHRYQSVELLLEHALLSEFKRAIPIELFWQACKEREFLLLVDGFDEIAPQVDALTRQSKMVQLSDLFNSGSPAILTCRPSYFVSTEEYNTAVLAANGQYLPTSPSAFKGNDNTSLKKQKELVAFSGRLRNKLTKRREIPQLSGKHQVLHLAMFSDEQIIQYLEKCESALKSRCSKSALEIHGFLRSLYDLSDLMKRPILLRMIVETVLEGAIDLDQPTQSFGPASLYEAYTAVHLDIDWDKGETRHFLSTDGRRLFAQLVALAMFDSSTLAVPFSAIEQVIEENKSSLPQFLVPLAQFNLQEIATDIQTCAFLTRGDDDLFRFVHKSFMEFFVAQWMKNSIIEGKFDDRLKGRLSKEILYFLGSFGLLDGRVKNFLLMARLGEVRGFSLNATTKRNVIGALLNTSPEIDNMSYSSVDLSELGFRGLTVIQSQFTDFSMSVGTWEKCVFQGSAWSMDCHKVTLTALTFERSFVSLRLVNSSLEGFTFQGGGLKLSGNGSLARSGKVDNASISLSGRISISSWEAVGSVFELQDDDGAFPSVESLECANCTIRTEIRTDGRTPRMRRSTLSDCRLDCLMLVAEDISGSELLRFEGVRIIGCDGLVLIVGDAGMKGFVLVEGSIVYADALLFCEDDDYKSGALFLLEVAVGGSPSDFWVRVLDRLWSAPYK